MKIFFRYSVAAVIITFFASGCKYEPDPIVPGKTVPSKTGSTYIYNNTPIDTNGHEMPDSAYMTVDSVASTETTFSGKVHVSMITSRNVQTGVQTISYFNYESNGDISEYAGGSLLSFLGITFPDWITYPVQSHETAGFKAFDDTVRILPIPIHVLATDSMTYSGMTTFSTGDKTLGIFKLNHTTIYQGQIILLPPPFPALPFGPNSQVTVFSYAPAIGFYAERRAEPFKFPAGAAPSVNGLDKKLVSYNLK
jgi:hypothetical protein